MQLPDWMPLISADEERFSEAKIQLASALQWIAYIESSYVQRDNGKALFLRWRDDENGVICTSDFAGTYDLRMHVNNLMMQFYTSGAPQKHKIELDERSPAEVEAWILSELLHRGIDRSKFSKNLSYELTGLMSGDDLDFSPSEYEAELTKLADLFQNAAHTMSNVAVESDFIESPECHFRISPQSLNMEIDLPNHIIGFSLGSGLGQDAPYFYTMRVGQDDNATAEEKIVKISDFPKEAIAQEVLDLLRHETRPH